MSRRVSHMNGHSIFCLKVYSGEQLGNCRSSPFQVLFSGNPHVIGWFLAKWAAPEHCLKCQCNATWYYSYFYFVSWRVLHRAINHKFEMMQKVCLCYEVKCRCYSAMSRTIYYEGDECVPLFHIIITLYQFGIRFHLNWETNQYKTQYVD